MSKDECGASSERVKWTEDKHGVLGAEAEHGPITPNHHVCLKQSNKSKNNYHHLSRSSIAGHPVITYIFVRVEFIEILDRLPE